MPSISLNTISKPEKISNGYNPVPLSFAEWQRRHIGIAFNDAQDQYKNYLNNFYTDLDTKTQTASTKIKDDYVLLLKKLSVIFENDEAFERYKNSDLTSETDLKLVIPAYAKKLKEIALLYAKKRNELKYKKLEYNLIGSSEGLERLIYNKLVSVFTKNGISSFNNENPLISQSPEFSAIRTDFEIEIEELYDTTDYFDKSDGIDPLTCIFNNICDSVVLPPTSALADPLEQNYICNPTNETVDELIRKAYGKYLGTDINYISGGFYMENWQEYTHTFTTGDNYFYWFRGKNVYDIPDGMYKDVDINDIDWSFATGGENMYESDIIFVNIGSSDVYGAWLQKTDYITVNATMSAIMKDGKIFKFPYCNYGLSAFGGEWNGPNIDDTAEKTRIFFPTEEDFTNNQKDVVDKYWTDFSLISTVQSINLQNTNIGSYGNASNMYKNADKIIITYDNGASRSIYNDNYQIAWLYKFQQSQLPIKSGVNNILFPITRYDDPEELFFNYDTGDSINLSSLDVGECFVGAVASETLDTSDMLIKKQSICGPEIEAAWLKAVPLKYFGASDKTQCSCDDIVQHFSTDWIFVSGGAQAGLSFKCESGDFFRFVWTGNTVDINTVNGFRGFSHDDSCPYKQLDHSVSLVDKNRLDDLNKPLFEKWKKCSCQAIHYSPMGHTQSSLEHFSITPDFIVKDTVYPNLFNKKTWVGSDGNNYTNSVDSARFIPEIIETDIGWGAGTWETQLGTSFILEKGTTYIYYRSKINNCAFDAPPFIINQKYDEGTMKDIDCEKMSFIPQWTKATQDADGVWVDSGIVSDMVLNFGDILTYNHKENYTEIRKKLLYNGLDSKQLSGDFITLSPSDSAISFVNIERTVPSINFLLKIPLNGASNYWATKYPDSSRIVFEYLHVTQPAPINITISDKNILEYKFGDCGSTCFVWDEPLTFQVYNPIFQWNKIDINNCVESDILNYLNSESVNCNRPVARCLSDCDSSRICGCEYFCNTTKIGTTPTYEKSTISFNTEVSGMPVFVNYFARSEFNQTFNVHNITDGEESLYVPVVTGLANTASEPWKNILNQFTTNFVWEESSDALLTNKEVAFYNPKKIGMGRYETHNSSHLISSNNNDIQFFKSDNFFNKPFYKNDIDSSYVVNKSLGYDDGHIQTPIQTFYPYTTTNERGKSFVYGLYDSGALSSVQYTNAWSDDVWSWDTDIFGNQYFITLPETIDYKSLPTTFGGGFIKLSDNRLLSFQNGLSSVFSKYINLYFGTSNTSDDIYITDEIGNYISIENGLLLLL